MKVQHYSSDDFKRLKNGCYFVLTEKKRTTSEFVYIYNGRCIKSDQKTKLKTLMDCYLQKFKEIAWDEEANLDKIIDRGKKKAILKGSLERVREKKSEADRRREYFQNFDKGKERRNPKKVYVPDAASVRAGIIIS